MTIKYKFIKIGYVLIILWLKIRLAQRFGLASLLPHRIKVLPKSYFDISIPPKAFLTGLAQVSLQNAATQKAVAAGEQASAARSAQLLQEERAVAKAPACR